MTMRHVVTGLSVIVIVVLSARFTVAQTDPFEITDAASTLRVGLNRPHVSPETCRIMSSVKKHDNESLKKTNICQISEN